MKYRMAAPIILAALRGVHAISPITVKLITGPNVKLVTREVGSEGRCSIILQKI
jgi:hypothetical protein